MDKYSVDCQFIPQGSGEERTEGVHLTQIIKSIEKELGWDYKGKGFDDIDLTMEIGFWWEDMLGKVMADRMAAFRPGEVVKDGIIGSPDGLGPFPGMADGENIILKPSKELILEEYKFTWKSCKKPPTDNWYYMTQGKSYCYMTGTTACLWRICYCNGNYKGSGPIYRECFVRFTEMELWQNWEMITSHAKEKGLIK